MSEEYRGKVLKKILFSLWAMASLVLVFCAALLAHDMIERGYHPLPPPRADVPPLGQEKERAEVEATRLVPLYFSDAEGRRLVAETRELTLGEYTSSNCRSVLEALIEGPKNGLTQILPPATRVRGVYLRENGDLIVDLSQELRTAPGRPKSVSAEALMAYGIVNTLTQSVVAGENGGTVKRVTFLIDKSPFDDTFPEHLDLSGPVAPDPSWSVSAENEDPRHA